MALHGAVPAPGDGREDQLVSYQFLFLGLLPMQPWENLGLLVFVSLR